MSRRDVPLPPCSPQDAKHQPLTRVQQLAADAAAAAEERALAEHPDIVALRVEKVRTQIDVLMWVGIGLGLAFTMVNVQTFAADGAAVWSLPWLAAWLLDPMVSLVLIAVLRAEQVTARWQVGTGRWISRTKWFAFAATYTMNTWQSWAKLDPAGIVLHSVPPLLVYLASEAAPVLRDRLTESVKRAAGQPARVAEQPSGREFTNTAGSAAPPVHGAVHGDVHDGVHAGVHEPAREHHPEPVHERREQSVSPPRKHRAKNTKRAGTRRTTRADYLATARAAWAPGMEITPAWVREQTGCSRGLSSTLAADLTAELTTPQHTRPAPAHRQDREAA